MKVAENVNQVTPSYIMSSLNHHYAGRNFKFSDRLTKILTKDFRKKADNLKWLFGDNTRIKMNIDPTIVYNAILKNSYVTHIKEYLEAIGCTIVPEDFIKGFTTHKKQRVRMSNLIENVDEFLPTAVGLSSDFLGNYTEQRIADHATTNKYKEHHTKVSDLRSRKVYGDTIVLEGKRRYDFFRQDTIQIRANRYFQSSLNVENMLSQTNMSDVYLSIDINDFITCSSGSCRSCLRIDGQHHLGWMQHFRADFSIIMFTHSSGNEFEKTGRNWIFVRMTEDGVPYVKPFYKMSKTYGVLNQAHRNVVDEFLQTRIQEVFGFGKPKKVVNANFSSNSPYRSVVSPNMAGSGHSQHSSGYFDFDCQEHNPFWVYPAEFPAAPITNDNYRQGPQCIFPFPDALNVHGRITNTTMFNNSSDNVLGSHLGWLPEDKFVKCKVTGEDILLDEATRLPDGTFITTTLLIQTAFPSFVKEAVEELEQSTTEIDVDSVDVDDF